MSEIQPRIVASEMEWQTTSKLVDSPPSQLDITDLGFFSATSRPDVTRTTKFLSNGAKYYLDIGTHLEYATPEDTRFHEGVVTNEMAGELFVVDSLVRYVKSDEKIEKVILSKRVIDDMDVAWGYHINLSTDRTAIPEISDKYLHLYALHLATSQAMLGAGMIRKAHGKHQYTFAQKINRIQTDYGSGTTQGATRPLINSRDESHSNDPAMRRLHIISTDPHISPWATRMAFGTSSLVLRAVEQGYGKDLRLDPSFPFHERSLSNLAKRHAADIDMIEKERYSDGNQYTALEVQKKIIEIVEKAELTDEETAILDEWKTALNDMEIDIMRLRNRSDAIAKLALIQSAMKKYDTDDISDPRITAVDQSYGQIAIINRKDLSDDTAKDTLEIYKKSIPHKLRKSLFAAYTPADAAVIDRTVNPPTTTRAALRGHHIRNGATSVDWSSARYTPTGLTITMGPYDTE